MKRVGKDSFLLCLHVECLEQFALLQFVQSTACMSLRDPAGLHPEPTYAEVDPHAVFYCSSAGRSKTWTEGPVQLDVGFRCVEEEPNYLVSRKLTVSLKVQIGEKFRGR